MLSAAVGLLSLGATAAQATGTGTNAVVNSIAFNGTDCSNAYIGGVFTSVNGTTVKNIAEVSTGTVVTAFAHSASGSVQTLLGVAGRIIAGGLLHLGGVSNLSGICFLPYN